MPRNERLCSEGHDTRSDSAEAMVDWPRVLHEGGQERKVVGDQAVVRRTAEKRAEDADEV